MIAKKYQNPIFLFYFSMQKEQIRYLIKVLHGIAGLNDFQPCCKKLQLILRFLLIKYFSNILMVLILENRGIGYRQISENDK